MERPVYAPGMQERGLGSSSERLWALIGKRTESGADTAAIDRRIRELFGEEWAVMFTDLAGFSRRVEEFGIIHFLQVIYEHKKLLFPLIEAHDGVLVKAEGDSLLLLFRTMRSALDCAVAMQRACKNVSARRKPEEQILLCVGIGFGELLRIGDEDVWGRELNAASKLGEDLAGAGEILLTGAARERLADETTTEYSFERLDDEVPGSPENFMVVYGAS